jgi:hypothetical protein
MTEKSEVAKLREQITLEYEATRRVFTDFTPTARHDFIVKRQENIAVYFEELKQYMAPEDAMELILQIENQMHNSSIGNR